jgi:ribosomal RNA assembly protein
VSRLIDEVKVGLARIKEVKNNIREIGKTFNVNIRIKDKNLVEIEGEGIDVWVCSKAIQGIARGFEWEQVRCLKDDEYEVAILDAKEFGRGTKKDTIRLKGRVIGEDGKSRRHVEEDTGATLKIYGKTVAIVGKIEDVELAKRAVIMLLEGAKHSTVYRFLERENLKRKRGNLA